MIRWYTARWTMAGRIMMNSYRSRKFSNFRNRYWIKKFKKCIIFSDLVKEWLRSWTNAADETLLLIMDNIQVFNFPKFYRKSVVTYKATNKIQLLFVSNGQFYTEIKFYQVQISIFESILCQY